MRWCKYLKVIFLVLISVTIFTVSIHKVPYEHLKHLVNNSVVERLFREEPCACIERCLAVSDDEWFATHFRKDVPPVLSLNNSILPDNIFKWWQSLQSTRSKANYSQVIKELFSVIPGEERYRDAGPSRCRTCAVVGNSGNLLGSYYGPVIDSHDFVFRMNKAPVQGYEKDVGSRTTHRIMYPESATHLDNNTHLVLLPFKTLDIQWVTSALTDGSIKRTRFKVIDKLQANKDKLHQGDLTAYGDQRYDAQTRHEITIILDDVKVMVMHPAFMHYVHTTWLHIKSRRSYPSTGFLVLIFAMHICDEVNVFGFGANSIGTWHHYFENTPKSFKRTGKHSGGIEQKTMLELQERRLIDIYMGW